MQTTAKERHPRAAAIEMPRAAEEVADTPFAEGSQDELDADLRHRLISDLAYTRYCQRGYVDGFDVEDWLEAEAEVDHMLLHPSGAA